MAHLHIAYFTHLSLSVLSLRLIWKSGPANAVGKTGLEKDRIASEELMYAL